MAGLSDFQANGISFPVVPSPDIDRLTERIPSDGTLHLAILQPPYLDLINEGTKTIESRFSTKRTAPYGKVAVGDLVLLKETGQPVTNYFYVAEVAMLDLAQTPVEVVRQQYADGIQAQNEDDFWRDRQLSRYATLLTVGERGVVLPLAVAKKDQRGWVSFTRVDDGPQTLFDLP